MAQTEISNPLEWQIETLRLTAFAGRDSSSGIADLKINRLTKWSVAGHVSAQVELSAQHVRYSRDEEPAFACRLELDINTSPELQGDLPKEKLPVILREMVNLGPEITKQGDIP